MNWDGPVRGTVPVTSTTVPLGTVVWTPAAGVVSPQSALSFEGTTTGQTAGTASGPISPFVPVVLVLALAAVVLLARHRRE